LIAPHSALRIPHSIRFAGAVCALACPGLSASVAADEKAGPPKRVAAVVTEYRQNSHADVIVGRLFQTQTLDGKGTRPGLELASLYTDQVPASDSSRRWSKEFGFPIFETVSDVLTLKTGALAVDGVLLVAEHGQYPVSETGQVQYPKRRLFEEIIKVFRASGRAVPVFIDKHLADNWQDAAFIYEAARELKIPLMAGSSLPLLWRDPPADVRRDAKLKQILAVSYGSLDAYGFHALEMVQALAERRFGGETGVRSVECLIDQAVWEAGERGVYDGALLDAVVARLKNPPVPDRRKLLELVPHPVLFIVHYADGLEAAILTLNGAVGEWSAAWRYDDGSIESTRFVPQESRPFMHFALLVEGIDRMMHTGRPTWPLERTLLTSGLLDALLISKTRGEPVETPYLEISYRSSWNWSQPAPPPPDRPIDQ
jgi:hypothetical protein